MDIKDKTLEELQKDRRSLNFFSWLLCIDTRKPLTQSENERLSQYLRCIKEIDEEIERREVANE